MQRVAWLMTLSGVDTDRLVREITRYMLSWSAASLEEEMQWTTAGGQWQLDKPLIVGQSFYHDGDNTTR